MLEKKVKKGTISYWKDGVMELKQCTKCKEIKLVECFNRRGNGYVSKCKECEKQYRKDNEEHYKQYYKDNKEHISEYGKQYYKDNKERVKERHRRYDEEHKEELKAYRKQYYKENAERHKESCKRWRENNIDHVKEYEKQYRKDNEEHIKEYGKQYNENNAEKIREYSKQHYKVHKERYKEQHKQYREANKEKIKERCKQYYENNKEHIKEKTKQWRENNPEYNKQRYEANKIENMKQIKQLLIETKPFLKDLPIYGYIYKITHKNGHCYIGQTIQPLKERYRLGIIKGWIEDRKKFKNQKFLDELIEEDFSIIEVLDVGCCKYHLDKLEAHYIDKYDSCNNGYNNNAGRYDTDDGIEEFEQILKENGLKFIDGKLVKIA